MTFNQDLSPLENGEEAANNLSQTLATEPKGITQKGLLYDLAIQTVLRTFDQITSAKKNNKWICFREWLQREEQVKKWNSKDKKAAKSYLQGIFQTLGVTEEFLICDIDFLIGDIETQQLSQPKLKKLWDKMLTWLKKHKELGVEYVILDGQNRINHALVPFRYNNLAISLAYNGYVHENVTYSSLDDYTRQQINERQFRVSVISGGDVTKVVDKLININDGEPWGDHETRDVLWTSVSFDIKSIASYPNTVKLHTNTLKNIWTGNYALHKKGVTLFIAEMLHYIRNDGNLGNSASLTKMYNAVDENIESQLDLLNNLFKLVANNFPKAQTGKNFSKETYRDIYIYLLMLIRPPVNSDIKNKLSASDLFKLDQIKNPRLLIERIILAHKKKFADRSQIIPFKKKSNVPLTDEEVKKMESNGDGGLILWSNTNAKPGTYLAHHSGSSKNDLTARVNLFYPDLMEIVDECLSDGTLTSKEPRRITSHDKMVAEVKYFGSKLDNQEELKTTIDKELHHQLSVKNGGDSNIENLDYISREDNRALGPN